MLNIQTVQKNYVIEQALNGHEHLSLKEWRPSFVQQTVMFFVYRRSVAGAKILGIHICFILHGVQAPRRGRRESCGRD